MVVQAMKTSRRGLIATLSALCAGFGLKHARAAARHCDACDGDFRGLTYAIPDDAWRAISDTHDLRGVLCPWCANERLAAAGLAVKVEVNLQLPALDGVNPHALRRFEEINYAMRKEEYERSRS
jgi:hypothetical protein